MVVGVQIPAAAYAKLVSSYKQTTRIISVAGIAAVVALVAVQHPKPEPCY